VKKHDANRYSAWWALALVLTCLWACAAIPSGAQWEIRAACMTSAQYGGFYSPEDAAGGGLDYSQSDNPILTLTDIACANATSTTLTSATGGFTLAMKGNGLYLSGGTNITAGWYCIKTYVDPNTVTVDRAANSGGLDGTGGTVRVGGAVAAKDATVEAMEPGNTAWIKADATHTLAGSIAQAKDGTAAAPIIIAGYNATRGDNPTGDNRPLLSGGTMYKVSMGDYVFINNIRISSQTNIAMSTGIGGKAANVQVVQPSASASINAFSVGANGTAINCDASTASSATAFAFIIGQQGCIIGCYANNSPTGITCLFDAEQILNCTIDTCVTGVSLGGSSADNIVILGCSFYSGTTGINIPSGCTGIRVVNSVISSFTTGITAADSSLGCVLEDYNNIYNCTTDRTNVPVGANSYDLDPGFADAAGGDFRVGVNCKAKGFPGAVPGAAATCIGYLDTGAVQRIEPTGGGTRATGGAW
jgi:hypothetical protein